MENQDVMDQDLEKQDTSRVQEEISTEASPEEPLASTQLQAELDELKDKHLRLLAEFDNYRKRMARERLEITTMAAKETLLSFLPVLDDLERAVKTAAQAEVDTVFQEGISLVLQKFQNTLRTSGVESFDCQGQPFDPETQEAVTRIPPPSPDLSGKVVDTLEKGYTLHGKIIRFAKVVVGM